MEIKNKHIETAYQLVSSLSVSGDAVDAVWAIRQQLLMAAQDFDRLSAWQPDQLEEVDGCST